MIAVNIYPPYIRREMPNSAMPGGRRARRGIRSRGIRDRLSSKKSSKPSLLEGLSVGSPVRQVDDQLVATLLRECPGGQFGGLPRRKVAELPAAVVLYNPVVEAAIGSNVNGDAHRRLLSQAGTHQPAAGCPVAGFVGSGR
jgi:hypothetical protein